jgi:hypothetical protein
MAVAAVVIATVLVVASATLVVGWRCSECALGFNMGNPVAGPYYTSQGPAARSHAQDLLSRTELVHVSRVHLKKSLVCGE